MKRFVICLYLLLFTTVDVISQNSIDVRGCIKDNFTYELLDSVNVDILHMDSTLVYHMMTRGTWRSYGFVHNVDSEEGVKLERGESYIIRMSKKGYETAFVDYKVKAGHRENWLKLPDFMLKREKRQMNDAHTLGEAVVQASKVRMVLKGDTIEWNADAFQLQNGSMLDDLLKMLPGFSINGGQIMVNGHVVNSLLVNGENFFRGDPRVALENLPGFMVSKVKAYHKEHAYSYITKERDINDLPLVVDVILKKQYSIGWTANAEAGYGLRDRYMGRLFGLRFTPNSRIAIFGNANNTNDTREPGTSGDWSPQSDEDGRSDVVKGGMELLLKDKTGIWKYTGNVKASYRRIDYSDASSSETFLPSNGNTFSRSANWNNTKSVGFNTMHNFEIRKERNFYNLSLSGEYIQNKQKGEARNAEFRENPYESYRSASLDTLFSQSYLDHNVPSYSTYLNAILLNQSKSQLQSDKKNWQIELKTESFSSVQHTPDFIKTNGSVTISRDTQEPFSDYRYNVAKEGAQSERRYWYSPLQHFNVIGHWNMEYMARLEKIWLNPFYEFIDNYTDCNSPRYRLDQLAEQTPSFGLLPSVVKSLNDVLDSKNSEWTRANTINQRLGTEIIFWWSDYRQHFHIKPIVVWQHDKLDYQRGELELFPHRRQCLFEPEISYRMDDFSIEYKINHTLPDLVSMQSYTDDSNPLYILQGNPYLKKSVSHLANIEHSFMKQEIAMNGRLAAYWSMTKNAIAHGISIDEGTGVRHLQPRNVNGNWKVGMSVDYGRRLDKNQHFIFQNTTDIGYQNSVDYVSSRSTVRNLNLHERIHLEARIGKHLFNATINGLYQHATSKRQNFQDINGWDLTYSLGCSIQLPRDYTFLVDLNLLEREGYNDKTMNDLRFVCNAQLNKMLMHGKMRITLQGFDLFHGLSNIKRVVNAQGNIETWRNTLPSYAMLRLAYRFDMKNKSR